MYYLCSENKGPDQLRGYSEADLRLCFRICKKPVFSRRGSFHCRAAGGKLVDATPDVQNNLQEELNRVDQRFSATGKNMAKFPEFKFDGKTISTIIRHRLFSLDLI